MVRYLIREGGIFCNPTLVVPWLFFVVFVGTLCILLVYFVVPLFLLNYF